MPPWNAKAAKAEEKYRSFFASFPPASRSSIESRGAKAGPLWFDRDVWNTLMPLEAGSVGRRHVQP